MVNFTFYGGIGEIGGNKILLEDGARSLLLDFGFPFKRHKEFYEEYLKPRAGAGLLDPLVMGLLPPLKGIYREDLQPRNLWDSFVGHPLFRELEGLDGVVLTHAHLDHSGYISFLRRQIPIYSSAMTAFIAKAIQDSGKAEFDQRVCYFAPVEIGTPSGWKQESCLSEASRANEQRNFRLGDCSPTNLTEEAITFWEQGFWEKSSKQKELIVSPLGTHTQSSFDLQCFPVDHSIPGATAWAIRTSVGWVVYTGDLRFHGRQSALTQRFVQEAAKLGPIVLITEGTRAGDDKMTSESEVADNLLRVVNESRGKLVFADFGARNVERLRIFLDIAKDKGVDRQLVISAKDAYLLRVIHLLDPTCPDVARDKSICIYQKTTGDRYPDKWQRNLYADLNDKVLLAEDIRRSPGSYILCFSFFDVNELVSFHPKLVEQGAVYIYSSSEPHDEEQEIDFRRLHKWLDHFRVTKVGLPAEVEPRHWEIPAYAFGFHASGHATGPELLDMVQQICPRFVIPIHTEKPEYFEQNLQVPGMNVIMVAPGETVRI
jgi:ribonuclease J